MSSEDTYSDEEFSSLPDYANLGAPPEEVRPVRCLHCEDEYQSSEIKWDAVVQSWVCKNWPNCGGIGYGRDIIPANCQLFVRLD